MHLNYTPPLFCEGKTTDCQSYSTETLTTFCVHVNLKDILTDIGASEQ